MSQPAVSWVIQNSTYRGAFLLLHLVVADTVDGQLELRVSKRWLALTAKVNRKTVDAFIDRAMADGYLVNIGDGPCRTANFRFVFTEGPPRGPRGRRKAKAAKKWSGERATRENGQWPSEGSTQVAQQWPSSGPVVAQSVGECGPVVAQSADHASSSFASTSPTRARTRRARLEPDDAPRAKKRERSNSQDPLAARLANVIGTSYEAALTELGEWRSAGVSDLVIDEATGYAAEHDGGTLAYVGKIAFHWMGQRNPGWRHSPADHADDHPDAVPLWIGDAIRFADLRWEIGHGRRPDPGALGQPLGGSSGRDGVADVVYFAIDDVGYDDALAAVTTLRAAGVSDDAIRWAAAKTVEVGGPTLAYVEAVARTRAGVPVVAPPPNGHAPKVIDLTDEGVA